MIEEKIKQLTQKQTWLKKEFGEFLLIWRELTKEIEDKNLKRIIIYTDGDDEDYYCLQTGTNRILKIDYESMDYKCFSNGLQLVATEIPVEKIRRIVENLGESLQAWEEKIIRCNQEYQDCIDFLRKFKLL